MRRFAIGFVEQKIQFAGRGISIHLFIPARLFASEEPLGQALVLFRRQALDCGLDFFNPVHVRSLALCSPRAVRVLRFNGAKQNATKDRRAMDSLPCRGRDRAFPGLVDA